MENIPLYWRVCLINGLVFVVGTAALALSPATVSARVLVSEAVLLVLGLAGILILNALLLRASLAPLGRLLKAMEHADLESPSQRVEVAGEGAVANLGHTFNAMLNRLEAERSSSNARALAAQEAERHRIAQELHDEIGQGLTVILLGLGRAAEHAPADLAEELVALRESTRATLDEVGEVARRLRPGVLTDLGLHSALAGLATDLARNTGAHVRRSFAPGLPTLTSDAEVVVYRVAQEALTNVTRHAAARNVDLSLTKLGASVVLRVSDDGVGRRGAAEGTGIRGMRERALLVHGNLTHTTPEGGGTEVRLVVPLEEG